MEILQPYNNNTLQLISDETSYEFTPDLLQSGVIKLSVFSNVGGFLDSTNDRLLVPSGKGGTYFISYATRAAIGSEQGNNTNANLRLNGSTSIHTDYKYLDGGIEQMTFGGSMVITLSAGDYLEITMMIDRNDNNSTNSGSGRNQVYISGFKLIT